MTRVQVIVFANPSALKQGKRLFEKFVDVPAATDFDYCLLVKSLRVLFGAGCIITFNISNL